jgi:hypothetical protein
VEEASPLACPWLRTRGLLREVVGYPEAVALLSDGRLHVLDVFIGEEVRSSFNATPMSEAP